MTKSETLANIIYNMHENSWCFCVLGMRCRWISQDFGILYNVSRKVRHIQPEAHNASFPLWRLTSECCFTYNNPFSFFFFRRAAYNTRDGEWTSRAGAGIITLNLYLLHRAAFVYHKRERKHTISQSHALGRARASFQVRITHFFLRFLGNRARCVQKKKRKREKKLYNECT